METTEPTKRSRDPIPLLTALAAGLWIAFVMAMYSVIWKIVSEAPVVKEAGTNCATVCFLP